MNQSTPVGQQSLPVDDRVHMSEPTEPWVKHPDIRDAFDRLDRIQSCLNGFKILMSPDSDRLNGKGADDVDVLLNYLMEEHDEVTASLNQLTWAALRT